MAIVATHWTFDIHAVVRLACCTQPNSTMLGYIHGRELYEDPSGTGEWYHVRFIKSDGTLGEQVKLHASEIAPAEKPDGFGFHVPK